MKPMTKCMAVLTLTSTVQFFQITNAASTEPNPIVSFQSSADSDMQLPADNPFAAPSSLPFHTPAFDKIKLQHYQPAFSVGMKQQLAEMEVIASHKETPTFENTIVAIEKSGALLTRVRNVFSNMTSAEKSKEIGRAHV